MDALKLEFEMKRKGVSIDEMCKKLNISRSAFYRKRNGKSDFTLKEIQTIIEILDLQTPVGIFFAEKVS